MENNQAPTFVQTMDLYRFDGTPVEAEDKQKYEAAFTVFFDKAKDRAGKDMLKLQRFLRFGEYALGRQFNTKITVTMPQTNEQWTELVKRVQGPIMLAERVDGLGVVAVVLDESNFG